MKIFLIVLLGLIGAYLISVAHFNAWDFLAGLEPLKMVKRLFLFAYEFAVCAFLTWFILSGLFNID